MAITGTGTQADPVCVETFGELITALQGSTEDYVGEDSTIYIQCPCILEKTKDTKLIQGKCYMDSNGERIISPQVSELKNYYENTVIWDLNETRAGEDDAVVEIRRADKIVLGRGITVKNYTSLSNVNQVFNSYWVKANFYDFNFTNMYTLTNYFMYLYNRYSYFNFYRCLFSGDISTNDFCYSSDRERITLYNCGFKSIGTTKFSCVPTLYRSYFEITNGFIDSSANFKIVSSYLKIKLSEKKGSTYANGWTFTDSVDSIVEIEDVAEAQISSFSGAQKCVLLNVSKLLSGENVTASAGFIKCTDEDLKSATQLQALGFPIGVDEQ